MSENSRFQIDVNARWIEKDHVTRTFKSPGVKEAFRNYRERLRRGKGPSIVDEGRVYDGVYPVLFREIQAEFPTLTDVNLRHWLRH